MNSITNSHKIISLAIPSLIAISILELINIEANYAGTNFNNNQLYTILNFLQLIPAFTFAYISDKHFRKKALIVSQILGFLGISILFIFGIKFWVLIGIAITFNPIPVARAALLDNFSHQSSLKIVAITFLAQYFPWIFYNQIVSFPLNSLYGFTLAILFINIILTKVLFRDRTDEKKTTKTINILTIINKINKRMMLTIISFMLAGMSLYLVWIYLQNTGDNFIWFDFTNLGIFIGVACSLFYSVLPHMTIITLFYAVGLCMYLVALITSYTMPYQCDQCLLNVFSHYSIVVGMYVIFVTEAVIKIFGARNKAIGAAVIELTNSIAMVISSMIFVFAKPNSTAIIALTIPFFLTAVLLQKKGEKEPLEKSNTIYQK